MRGVPEGLLPFCCCQKNVTKKSSFFQTFSYRWQTPKWEESFSHKSTYLASDLSRRVTCCDCPSAAWKRTAFSGTDGNDVMFTVYGKSPSSGHLLCFA